MNLKDRDKSLSNDDIKCDRPVIFISLPHGVTPFASVLSPLVSPDIFKTAAVGTVASVLFYIPLLDILLNIMVHILSQKKMLNIY